MCPSSERPPRMYVEALFTAWNNCPEPVRIACAPSESKTISTMLSKEKHTQAKTNPNLQDFKLRFKYSNSDQCLHVKLVLANQPKGSNHVKNLTYKNTRPFKCDISIIRKALRKL